MAPNGDSNLRFENFSNTNTNTSNNNNTITLQMPPPLSIETLKRTISDIAFDLTCVQETLINNNSETKTNDNPHQILPPIPEVEDAKCECCGMSEECTPHYVKKVRDKFFGRMVCGLCSEAVEEEMEKNGGKREEALHAHVNACSRFNRVGRAYPVLGQAEVMRQILRKNGGKSLSPRDSAQKKPGLIARSSSCIPDIAKEVTAPKSVIK